MTFLELVNTLRIECGASGRTLTTIEGALPAEIERMKRWIRDSWNDIQVQHSDWQFHFVESSHKLAVGERVVDMPEFTAGEVAEWSVNSFRISLPGLARKESQPIVYVEYFDWRDGDGRDTARVGRPDTFTVHPTSEAVILSPIADQEYEMFYDYLRTPQVLVDDLDVPLCHRRFHDLIVAWAMNKYGYHESAPEKLAQARDTIGRLFPALEIDQLPAMTMGTLE